jgi:FAD/FMN-containing dehydrogenase
MAGARSWAAALEPYSSGTYVNVIADPGDEGIGRAYLAPQLARLADLKRKYDPDNVFHLNQNIRPSAEG